MFHEAQSLRRELRTACSYLRASAIHVQDAVMGASLDDLIELSPIVRESLRESAMLARSALAILDKNLSA